MPHIDVFLAFHRVGRASVLVDWFDLSYHFSQSPIGLSRAHWNERIKEKDAYAIKDKPICKQDKP